MTTIVPMVVPNAETAGMGEMDVAKNAMALVNDVTVMALTARL